MELRDRRRRARHRCGGERQFDLDRLAEAGNRMLAILRSLEDQHATGFVRLRFEEGALVGASLGRHALVVATTEVDDDTLIATIDEIRAILADQDLSAVASQDGVIAHEPDAPEPVEQVVAPPPLVGARFGGPSVRKERTSRRQRR